VAAGACARASAGHHVVMELLQMLSIGWPTALMLGLGGVGEACCGAVAVTCLPDRAKGTSNHLSHAPLFYGADCPAV